MVLGDQTAALNLGHELQHADHETDDGETTDTTVDWLVQAAHEKIVLDDCHQDRHGGILFLPAHESVDCVNSSEVLERNVHFQSGESIHELDERNSRMRNDFDRIVVCHALAHKKLLKLIQPTLGASVRRRTTTHVAGRADDEIHVCSGQVQA